MSLSDTFYPSLTAEEFFFAYPDEEIAEHFFNETLGSFYSGVESLDLVSMHVLDHLHKSAGEVYERAVSHIFLKGIPVNVAVVATWMYILDHQHVNVHPMSGYIENTAIIVLNRPLTLALTNEIETINSDGSLTCDLDIESIGLMDCARRTINQLRSFGLMVHPVQRVDDNLLQLYNKIGSEMNMM